MIRKIGRVLNDLATPAKIVLSFLAIILLGSFLLSLPISQLPGSKATYFDHLFTAVSMICVTGLYTQPVYATYNTFGKWINIFLMQSGGLGIITLVAAVFTQLGRRVSVRDELTLGEALNREELTDFPKFIRSVIKYTFVIEFTGMALLSFYFVPKWGFSRGVFTSFYLAVSAFNNAGFDPFGANSLIDYVGNPLITFVIPGLIILGGIGFSVWIDVVNNVQSLIKEKKWKPSFWIKQYHRLQLHSQMVINFTVLLLTVGTVLFLAAEWNNPASIGSLSVFDKLQASYFQSATMRTAGFASVDYTKVTLFSILMFCGLMFIGGSPGGTAGGTKTSTVALVTKLIFAETRGLSQVNYKKHTLSLDIIRRGLVIIVAFTLTLFAGIALLALFDSDKPFEFLVFEAFSALATVGVSANLTPTLSRMSQSVLMCLMFLGRLGPITIFTALRMRKKKSQKEVVYATGHILIG